MARLPLAVLFDWDGTLVDSLAAIYRANTRALATIGITMDWDWFRERYTPDWRRSYAELGVPEHLYDELADRWAREMQHARPRALPHARRGLWRLQRRGVRLGVVTASMRAVVEPGIERLNLGARFEVVVCSDDVPRTKPHPDGLHRALEILGLDAEDALYVGDTPTDLAMAAAAGTPFVAVGGTTDAAVFEELGVERVWPGVGEWVNELLGERGGR
jgi:HAD superfamily hydrolase (TIGR01509 family)